MRSSPSRSRARRARPATSIASTAQPCARRAPPPPPRARARGDRARVALQVAGEEVAPCTAPVSAGSRSRTSSASSSAPPPRRARSRAGSAAQVAASGCTISAPLRRILRLVAEPLLELVVQLEPGARELELRPGVLVGAEHVALAEPGRAARDRAAVEQRHRRRRGRPARARPPRRRSRRRRRRRRAAHRAKPAGNGSSASSRYCPMPVIHARPVISGTIAGPPADRRLPDDAAGEARADHRLVDERRRRRRARRGRAAGPSGATCRSRTASGRASRGGSRSPRARRRRRGRARGRRRGAAGDPRVLGMDRPVGALIAAMIARPASISSSARAGSTSSPTVGGGHDRVEVAAEGHVVADRRRGPTSTSRSRRVQERRARCAASPRWRGRPRPRRAPRPARPACRAARPVSGSVTGTMPVSTSTVATPIVPWPHIGRQPETSMNSTPQSASWRVGGWRIAPDIAACPRGSCMSRSRRSSICASKSQLALEHRGARDRPDAAGDDAGRHPLGVGVDRGEERAPRIMRRGAARAARRAPRRAPPGRRRRAPAAAGAPARRRSRARPGRP